MQKEIKIGKNTYRLDNSIYVLKVYKDIYKRPWHSDRIKSDADNLNAMEFAVEWNKIVADLNKKYKINEHLDVLQLTEDKKAKYFEELDALFNSLPKEKQNKIRSQMKESNIDYEFILNTIYAMVVAGGFKGTQEEFLQEIPPHELNSNSALMKTTSQFMEDFYLLKKNNA